MALKATMINNKAAPKRGQAIRRNGPNYALEQHLMMSQQVMPQQVQRKSVSYDNNAAPIPKVPAAARVRRPSVAL